MHLQKLLVNNHDLTRRSSTGLPMPRLSRKHISPHAPLDDPEIAPTSSTPDSVYAVGITSRATRSMASASTVESTTSDPTRDSAEDIQKAEAAGTAAPGARGGATLSRRASAQPLVPGQILESNDNIVNPKLTDVKKNIRQRSGKLWPAEDSGDSRSRSKCNGGVDDKGSSGCQGDSEDMSDTPSDSASADAAADHGDYALATDEELAALNLDLIDPDAEDMKVLDEMLRDYGQGIGREVLTGLQISLLIQIMTKNKTMRKRKS
jgi:hypothetical protein